MRLHSRLLGQVLCKAGLFHVAFDCRTLTKLTPCYCASSSSYRYLFDHVVVEDADACERNHDQGFFSTLQRHSNSVFIDIGLCVTRSQYPCFGAGIQLCRSWCSRIGNHANLPVCFQETPPAL